MTVYVDSFYTPFRRMKMCHMLADTEEELHEMAERIGMRRSWFQGDHYDVSKSKRALAVAAGAREVTSREIVDVRRRWREKYGGSRAAEVIAEIESALDEGRDP